MCVCVCVCVCVCLERNRECMRFSGRNRYVTILCTSSTLVKARNVWSKTGEAGTKIMRIRNSLKERERVRGRRE